MQEIRPTADPRFRYRVRRDAVIVLVGQWSSPHGEAHAHPPLSAALANTYPPPCHEAADPCFAA